MNQVRTARFVARSLSLLLVAGIVGAGSAGAQQTIGGCPVLPANNIWNTPVDTLPVLSEFRVDGEHDRREHWIPRRFRRRHSGTAARSAFRSSRSRARRRSIRRRFSTTTRATPARTPSR